jgi:hypothetical protein
MSYIDRLLLFLFTAHCLIILINFPDLSSLIDIPKAIIVYYEIIVLPLVLSPFVLIFIDILEDLLCFINLNN